MKYTTRGFVVSDVFADNEFDSDKYRLLFLLVNLHFCVQGEHVPVIERSIRTVKERIRSTWQGLPHTSLPRIMFASLLERVEGILNNFPAPSEPQSLPQIMLVEGKNLYDVRKPSLLFGTPAYVYTGSDNTMESRATLAITLRE